MGDEDVLFYAFTSSSFYGEFVIVVCKFSKFYYESWGRREWRVMSRPFGSNVKDVWS